ncbi:hypothetical protein KM176_12975 [Pseudooceanicola sp. CBS1P-1]|uniref:Uncharacterized protein n=1 Tax=Pseudooceanicola albus TaxID=2692189 RepID=A0A6L7G4Y8_9RHOB|nr:MULTISPECIES: hypothetical protein [Pseudooceanicola]MBT9384775.1 hypothetical protein [Pseudooceanicola endophyticus]MXN18476.1 hypothetical protein [Pseudooceanicola albus]
MKSETTKFAAYLSLDEARSVWRVRSIDVSHGGVLHKLTYPDMPELEDVFIKPMATTLLDHLGRMDPDGEMYANSDFELDLRMARFYKLRMHTNCNAVRGHEASFWFSSFEGQPLAALTQYAEPLAQLPPMDPVNNLAIQAMDRVLIPALNVVAAARTGLPGQDTRVFDDYASRLIQEADDLIMYAELVKRLILSQDGDAELRQEQLQEALAQPPSKRLGRTGS